MKGFGGEERSPLSTQGLQGLWRQMQRLIMMWWMGKMRSGSEEEQEHDDSSLTFHAFHFAVDYCVLQRSSRQ